MPHRSRDARLRKCNKHYASHRKARLAYAKAVLCEAQENNSIREGGILQKTRWRYGI